MYASAPTRPDARIVMVWAPVISRLLPTMSLRVRCVMLQNRNRMPAALISADMMLTMYATFPGAANSEKKFAASMKNGAPGGCPTSSLFPERINSGQSQKLAVGSTVRQYVTAAIMNVSHPKVLFNNLNRFIIWNILFLRVLRGFVKNVQIYLIYRK